ncbi:uncharacterized protein ACRADG_009637 [Cochliomyia hominivorax]
MSLAALKRINTTNFLKCSKYFPRMASSNKPSSEAKAADSKQSGKSAKAQCGDRFKNAPCDANKQTAKVKLTQPAPSSLPQDKKEIKIKRSVFCCGDPCPDALPRFDKLFYRRSDKATRVYTQTWDECPEQFIRPKVICCHKPIKPKFKKRPRKERPQTACAQEVCYQSKTKCPHIKMPHCRAGRKPPSCLTQRKPAKCLKRKSPYPSFSECTRKPSKPIHPIECKCLAIPSICEVWAYYHRKQVIKKPNEC